MQAFTSISELTSEAEKHEKWRFVQCPKFQGVVTTLTVVSFAKNLLYIEEMYLEASLFLKRDKLQRSNHYQIRNPTWSRLFQFREVKTAPPVTNHMKDKLTLSRPPSVLCINPSGPR